MNVVTTKWLVEDVTPKLGIEYLENLGITTMDEDRMLTHLWVLAVSPMV